MSVPHVPVQGVLAKDNSLAYLALILQLHSPLATMNFPDVPEQALALDEELVARLALELVLQLRVVFEQVTVRVEIVVGEVKVVSVVDVVHQVLVVVAEIIVRRVVRPDPFVALVNLLDVAIQDLLKRETFITKLAQKTFLLFANFFRRLLNLHFFGHLFPVDSVVAAVAMYCLRMLEQRALEQEGLVADLAPDAENVAGNFVDFVHVLLEVLLVSQNFVANFALAVFEDPPLALRQFLVPLEISSPGERLAANFALLGFESFLALAVLVDRLDVPVERAPAEEALVADLTEGLLPELPLAAVSLFVVPLQDEPVGEAGVAELAFSVVVVRLLHVLLQRLPLQEGHVANVALERPEEDVVAFVGLIQVPHQLAPVREGLFAEVALLLDPPPEQSLILKIGKRTEGFSGSPSSC